MTKKHTHNKHKINIHITSQSTLGTDFGHYNYPKALVQNQPQKVRITRGNIWGVWRLPLPR